MVNELHRRTQIHSKKSRILQIKTVSKLANISKNCWSKNTLVPSIFDYFQKYLKLRLTVTNKRKTEYLNILNRVRPRQKRCYDWFIAKKMATIILKRNCIYVYKYIQMLSKCQRANYSYVLMFVEYYCSLSRHYTSIHSSVALGCGLTFYFGLTPHGWTWWP